MSAELHALPAPKKETWKRLEKGLFEYVPTGEIYVRKTFHKELLPDLNANTHEKTIGKARRQAELLIAEHRAKAKSGIVQGRTLGDVIQEVLRTVTPTRRARTQEGHNLYLRELQRELGHFPINDFSRATWNSWFPAFKRRKGRTTYGDYAKNLNLVLRYAYQNRMASHLVTIPSPDPKGKPTGRVYSQDEVRRLMEHATGDIKDQLLLCYFNAMRMREVLYLTWDRVNLDTGLIILRAEDVKTGSRTGKGRELYADQSAVEALRERFAKSKGSPFVFPNPLDPKRPMNQNKTAWRTLKRKAGIVGKARFHDLRHTAITHLLLVFKMEPLFVSQHAGVSVNTIQRVYLHSTAEHTRRVSGVLSAGLQKSCENSVNEGDKQ